MSPRVERTAPPADLRARVLQSAGASPSRPRRLGVRAVAIGLGAAVCAIELVRAAAEGHGAAAAVPLFVFVIPALTAVALSGVAVAGRRGMFGPPLGRVILALVAAPLALVASAFAAVRIAGPIVATGGGDAPVAHAGLGFAGIALFTLLALAPPRDPSLPAWSGALVGAAAGAWLSVSCGLTCPVLAMAHVLSWHLAWIPGLALVGAGLGWAYGRLWLRANVRPF